MDCDSNICHSGLVCFWQLLLVAAMAWIKFLLCCLSASVSIVNVSLHTWVIVKPLINMWRAMARGGHFRGASNFLGFSWALLIVASLIALLYTLIHRNKFAVSTWCSVVCFVFCWKPFWRWAGNVCQEPSLIHVDHWQTAWMLCSFPTMPKAVVILGFALSERMFSNMHWAPNRAGLTGFKYTTSSPVQKIE